MLFHCPVGVVSWCISVDCGTVTIEMSQLMTISTLNILHKWWSINNNIRGLTNRRRNNGRNHLWPWGNLDNVISEDGTCVRRVYISVILWAIICKMSIKVASAAHDTFLIDLE